MFLVTNENMGLCLYIHVTGFLCENIHKTQICKKPACRGNGDALNVNNSNTFENASNKDYIFSPLYKLCMRKVISYSQVWFWSKCFLKSKLSEKTIENRKGIHHNG